MVSADPQERTASEGGGRKRERVLGGLLLTWVLGTGVYAARETPREDVLGFLAFYALSLVVFGLALYVSRAALPAMSRRQVLLWVLIGAAALRTAASFAPTSLSDDAYRYAWDGHLLVDGQNPYGSIPEEVHREVDGRGPYSAELFSRLNSPRYYSVYPPVTQLTFALGAGLSRVTGVEADRMIRGLLAAADLVSIWLMIGLLRRLGRPQWWALLYAWNPMVYWEAAGGGHTETLMLPFMLLAVHAALREDALRLGLALGMVALTKPTGLVLAPMLAWYLRCRIGGVRGFWAALIAAGVSLLLLGLGVAPFLYVGFTQQVGSSFALYFGEFSFNAPLLELGRALDGYQRGVHADPMDTLLIWFQWSFVFVLVSLSLWVGRRMDRLMLGLSSVALAHVLFSAVVHPWYLLLPLGLAVSSGWVAPFWLGGTVMLSYLAYPPFDGATGEVPGWVLMVEYGIFLAALMTERWVRVRHSRQRPSDSSREVKPR